MFRLLKTMNYFRLLIKKKSKNNALKKVNSQTLACDLFPFTYNPNVTLAKSQGKLSFWRDKSISHRTKEKKNFYKIYEKALSIRAIFS